MTKHLSLEIDEQISHGSCCSPSEAVDAALKWSRCHAELEAIAAAAAEGWIKVRSTTHWRSLQHPANLMVFCNLHGNIPYL